MEVVYLKILSDIHCEVYVDNEMKVVAPKNTLTKIQLLQGEYYVQLVSTVNPNYKIERVVSLDYDKVLNVQFSEIVRLHPEYLRDTDVIWIRDNQSYKAKNLVSGKIISDAYDYVNAVNDFKNGISIVYKNKLVGVVDIQGKEVIPCSFEAIGGIYGRNILSVKQNDKYTLLNYRTCKKTNDYQYDEIQVFEGKSIVGYRDGGCAFINNNGEEDLFLPQYKYSEGFRGDYAIVSIGESAYERKYGVINKNADEVLPCIHDSISICNGLFKVVKNGKYGIVDQTGNEVIPCRYDYLSSFCSEGLIEAKQKGKYGFINLKGETIIPFKYDDVHDWSWPCNDDYWFRYFSESGIAIVSVQSKSNSIDSKYGLVTKNGIEIFSCNFSKRPRIILKDQVCLIDNKDQLFIVYPDGQYRYLKYQHVGRLEAGLAVVKYNGMYGYIDENLNEVIPCIYDAVERCSQNGLFIVRKNKYYGVIAKDGTEIIPFKYKRMEVWGNGLLKVAMYNNDFTGTKYGVITEDGREVIPCIYDEIGSNYVNDQKIDECLNFLEENIIPIRKGKCGYADAKGHEIIPCVYWGTEYFRNGIGRVYQSAHSSLYIDRYGNSL